MRSLVLVAIAACGSKSGPAAPTVTASPPPAPARPAIAEAPGAGAWMKLTDGGGLVLTNPGRWVCATIADGKREDEPVTRTSCTLPILEVDTDLLSCPDVHRGEKVVYDEAGRVTEVGSQLTWTGDTLSAREGTPIEIDRRPDRMQLRSGVSTTVVDVDPQGRVTRIRTWVGSTRRAPDAAVVYAYAGDEVVSAVHQIFHLPSTELVQRDLISCATAAAPVRRTRARMPATPSVGSPRACDVIADHEVALATLALKGKLTVEDAAARRALVLADCTGDAWDDALRGCAAAATDHAMFLECLR